MTEYSVHQAVATGSAEALVALRLSLPLPVWEVTSIQKTILIDRADVTLGSALLQGRLRACYTIAPAPDQPLPPPLGSPPPPGGETQLLHTRLQALWGETPFCIPIAIPEAQPQMVLTLLAAHVTDQAVRAAEFTPAGAMLSLDDQSIIHLAVRISRLADLRGAVPDRAPVPPAGEPGERLRPSTAPQPLAASQPHAAPVPQPLAASQPHAAPVPQPARVGFARFQSTTSACCQKKSAPPDGSRL